MIKEQLLKYQIEQVEKAGYYVIPMERVRRLGVKACIDLASVSWARSVESIERLHKDQMLSDLGNELVSLVRWSVEDDEGRMMRFISAMLTVITPQTEKKDETVRRVPRFTNAPGWLAGICGQGEKGGAPGAG